MTEKQLTIISLNVFGTPFHPKKIVRSFLRNQVRKRFNMIAKILIQQNADVIFLQEVHDYFHASYLRRKLRRTYPYIAYKYTIFGPRGGLMTLSKYPIDKVFYQDFFTQGKYRDKSITGHLSQKGLLIVPLKDRSLWLVNTHLIQNSDHDWSPTNRYVPLLKEQLDQVIRFLNRLKTNKHPVIIAGDFNIPKQTAYYSYLLKETQLHDMFKDDSFPTYHESFLPEGAHVGRLDYIFHSSSLKLNKNEYFLKEPIKDNTGKELYLSDHIGLKGILSLQQN